MVELVDAPGCQVALLCRHFGETRAEPCGHCTRCLGHDRAATLLVRMVRPLNEAILAEAMTVRHANQEDAGRPGRHGSLAVRHHLAGLDEVQAFVTPAVRCARAAVIYASAGAARERTEINLTWEAVAIDRVENGNVAVSARGCNDCGYLQNEIRASWRFSIRDRITNVDTHSRS